MLSGHIGDSMPLAKLLGWVSAVGSLTLASLSQAAQPEAPNQSPPSAMTTQSIRVPAGTTLEVEFVDTLSSKVNTTGQTFALRLRQPVTINGQIVLPAGTMGGGEVLDASKSGMGGRSGKLVLSGRFIEFRGQRIRIRGLQSVQAGKDNSRAAFNTMLWVPYVGFLGGFIQGGDIEVPSGTPAQALLAADFVVTVTSPSAPPASETTPVSSPSLSEVKGNP
jgi:hypothetical protein